MDGAITIVLRLFLLVVKLFLGFRLLHRGLFIKFFRPHLAKHAFTLHFLFHNTQRLVYVVVTNTYLQHMGISVVAHPFRLICRYEQALV